MAIRPTNYALAGWSGKIADPRSPAGGGGPGHTRSATPLGTASGLAPSQLGLRPWTATKLPLGTIPDQIQYFRRRNEIAIEYVIDNKTVQDLVSDLATKIAVDSQVPLGGKATDVLYLIRDFWNARTALNDGNYTDASRDFTRVILEGFVEIFGSPALDYPLDIAKIVAAAATAYMYGLIFGISSKITPSSLSLGPPKQSADSSPSAGGHNSLDAAKAPPRLARALEVLRQQVNARAPKRSRASDGTIGDAAHATRKSDHNPWVLDGVIGVVTAMDITHDPAGGCDAGTLARAIVHSRDRRVKYVIWNRQIADSSQSSAPWTWRFYDGPNPHDKHVHVSVRQEKAAYDDESPWLL
jgi:hypothetical protein